MAHDFNIQIKLFGILWGDVGSQTADVPGLLGLLLEHSLQEKPQTTPVARTPSSVPVIFFKAGDWLRGKLAH